MILFVRKNQSSHFVVSWAARLLTPRHGSQPQSHLACSLDGLEAGREGGGPAGRSPMLVDGCGDLWDIPYYICIYLRYDVISIYCWWRVIGKSIGKIILLFFPGIGWDAVNFTTGSPVLPPIFNTRCFCKETRIYTASITFSSGRITVN